jgi:hypothetical protein
MEEQPVPAPTISLGNLIVNVFSSPSEAFEGLRTSPSRASTWVLPLILLIVFASLMSYVMFSNETLRAQFMDSQSQRLQQRVQSGQMTQEQADQAMQQTERMGGMMIAFGIIGSVITMSILFFGAALVFWLVGKLALKAPAGYGKYLELWGTSEWIGLLGGIITLLMVLGMGSMYASPSAALAVLSNFNPSNTVDRLLGSLNIFSIWQVIVLGIGLSKYAEKPLGTGIGFAVGLWVIWVLITTFVLGAFLG